MATVNANNVYFSITSQDTTSYGTQPEINYVNILNISNDFYGAPTESLLGDGVGDVLSGAEELASDNVKAVLSGAGLADDAYSVGQHLAEGMIYEAAREGSAAVGSSVGATITTGTAYLIFGTTNPITLLAWGAGGSALGGDVGEAIFLQANAPEPPPPGTVLEPTLIDGEYNYYLVDDHWFVEHNIDNFPGLHSYSYGAITVPERLFELSALYCQETLPPDEYAAVIADVEFRLAHDGQSLAEIEANIAPVGSVNIAPPEAEEAPDTRTPAERIAAGETPTGEPVNEFITSPNSTSKYIWVRTVDGTFTKIVDAGDGIIVEYQYSDDGEYQLILVHDINTGEVYTHLDNRPTDADVNAADSNVDAADSDVGATDSNLDADSDGEPISDEQSGTSEGGDDTSSNSGDINIDEDSSNESVHENTHAVDAVVEQYSLSSTAKILNDGIEKYGPAVSERL